MNWTVRANPPFEGVPVIVIVCALLVVLLADCAVIVLVPLPEIDAGENEMWPDPVVPLHVKFCGEVGSLHVRATVPEKPPNRFVRLSKLVSVKVFGRVTLAELADSLSVKSATLKALLMMVVNPVLAAVSV